jgi:hypothetical protein
MSREEAGTGAAAHGPSPEPRAASAGSQQPERKPQGPVPDALGARGKGAKWDATLAGNARYG